MKNEIKATEAGELPQGSVDLAGCLVSLQHKLGEESQLQTT